MEQEGRGTARAGRQGEHPGGVGQRTARLVAGLLFGCGLLQLWPAPAGIEPLPLRIPAIVASLLAAVWLLRPTERALGRALAVGLSGWGLLLVARQSQRLADHQAAWGALPWLALVYGIALVLLLSARRATVSGRHLGLIVVVGGLFVGGFPATSPLPIGARWALVLGSGGLAAVLARRVSPLLCMASALVGLALWPRSGPTPGPVLEVGVEAVEPGSARVRLTHVAQWPPALVPWEARAETVETVQSIPRAAACGGWAVHSDGAQLVAAQPDTGVTLRIPGPVDAPAAACALAGDQLLVAFSGEADGVVVAALELETREWRWRRRLPLTGAPEMMMSGRDLVMLSGGSVVRVAAEDGSIGRQWAVGEQAFMAAPWVVDAQYAVRFEDGSPTIALRWPGERAVRHAAGVFSVDGVVGRFGASVVSLAGELPEWETALGIPWLSRPPALTEQRITGDQRLDDPWQGLVVSTPRRSGWVVFGRDRSERRGRLELVRATDWRRTLTVETDYPGPTELETVVRRQWGPGAPERCEPELWAGFPAVRCAGPAATTPHRDVTAVRRGAQVVRVVVDVDEPDAPVEGVRDLVELEPDGRPARLPEPLGDATGPDWRVRNGLFVSDAYGISARTGGAWTIRVDPWLGPEHHVGTEAARYGDGFHGVVALESRDPDVTIIVTPLPRETGRTARRAQPIAGGSIRFGPVEALPGREAVAGTIRGRDRSLGIEASWWRADGARAQARLAGGLARLGLVEPPMAVGDTTLMPSVGPSHRLDGHGFLDHGLNIRWRRPDGTLWRVRRVANDSSTEVLRFTHAGLEMTASLHANHIATEDGEAVHDTTVATVIGLDELPSSPGEPDVGEADTAAREALEALETHGIVMGGLGGWETWSDDASGRTHIVTVLSGGIAYSLLVRVPRALVEPDDAAVRQRTTDALAELMRGFRLGQSMDHFEIAHGEVRDPLMGYAFGLPEGWSADACERRPGIGVECRVGRSEITVTVTALGDPFVDLDDAFETMEAGFRRFLEARKLTPLGSGRAIIAGRRARHLAWRPGGGLEAHEYRLARERTLYGISIVTDEPQLIERWRRNFRLLEQ